MIDALIIVTNAQQPLRLSIYFVISWFSGCHSGPRPNSNEGRLKHCKRSATGGCFWIYHSARGAALPVRWSRIPVLLDLCRAATSRFNNLVATQLPHLPPQHQDDQNLVTLRQLGALGLHRVGTQVGNPSHLHSHPNPADSMEG